MSERAYPGLAGLGPHTHINYHTLLTLITHPSNMVMAWVLRTGIGTLTHQKMLPPRTQHKAYAWSHMVVLLVGTGRFLKSEVPMYMGPNFRTHTAPRVVMCCWE